MADPFVAEIRIFGFNFAPRGWAFCDGQLLPLSQNTALFALVGTFYGGNGKSNFALPNLMGASPMHAAQGSGLSERFIGEQGGSETVTLLPSEIPVHTHSVRASPDSGDNTVPGPGTILAGSQGASAYGSDAQPMASMAPQALAPAGGSLPHNNLMPYQTYNFCIALQGVFPPRQ